MEVNEMPEIGKISPEIFNIDPYASISEGTLIIACREHKAGEMVWALMEKGIKSSIAGELTEPGGGMILVEESKEKKLEHPIVDPFWRAFHDAIETSKTQSWPSPVAGLSTPHKTATRPGVASVNS